ncbi:MAG TPA: adenylate/guanylate cyclase domain-containing protein, partial [Candidatus Ozemobacteraceae bacterium]|nr:adenylate/guanylate cyclase domain-containing protein [Candidatus Ozemobacteraceae bacterium]
SIVREPGLHEHLTTLETATPSVRTQKLNAYFDRLVRKMQQNNLDVRAILLYGPGEGAGYYSPQAKYSPATVNMINEFHLAFSLELLRRRFPGFVREEKRLGIVRKASINAFISHGIGGTNQELFEALDTLSPFRSEGRQSLRYHNLILPESATDSRQIAPYLMVILWDQNPGFQRYLSETTIEANRLQQAQTTGGAHIQTMALHQTPDGFKRISHDVPHPEFASLLRKARYGGFLNTSGTWLHAGFPSTRMPGFFLAACSSLEFIDDRVRTETRRLAGAFLLLILFLLTAGQALSIWLGSPIVRMTDGLRRVAADDLSVQVAERRQDELGRAGAYLDEMIRSLKERQVMSRFVAPQVLDVVGQGNFHEAFQPQTREVALLVSDVRSFTTMSESHSPAEIFALINRHLQVMTRIIQKHGGAIDRFIGDAIQAVFYAGPGEHMVRRALKAADEMMTAHHTLIAERQRAGLFPYGIGVGVEIGEVVTGVLGDRDVRLDFTVMGEPFKHAADPEGASKKGKARLIICSDRV